MRQIHHIHTKRVRTLFLHTLSAIKFQPQGWMFMMLKKNVLIKKSKSHIHKNRSWEEKYVNCCGAYLRDIGQCRPTGHLASCDLPIDTTSLCQADPLDNKGTVTKLPTLFASSDTVMWMIRVVMIMLFSIDWVMAARRYTSSGNKHRCS